MQTLASHCSGFPIRTRCKDSTDEKDTICGHRTWRTEAGSFFPAGWLAFRVPEGICRLWGEQRHQQSQLVMNSINYSSRMPDKHTHSYTHTHILSHTHSYTQSYTHTYTHYYTHSHTHRHTRAHSSTYTHIHTHTQTCTITYTHTHIFRHTHSHTHWGGEERQNFRKEGQCSLSIFLELLGMFWFIYCKDMGSRHTHTNCTLMHLL